MSKQGCSSCKNPGKLSNFNLGMVAIGFYITVTSIYGTIKLIERLISLF